MSTATLEVPNSRALLMRPPPIRVGRFLSERAGRGGGCNGDDGRDSGEESSHIVPSRPVRAWLSRGSLVSPDLAESITFIEDFKRNLGAPRKLAPASDVPERPCDHVHDCNDDSEDDYKRCVQNEVYQCAYHASNLGNRTRREWQHVHSAGSIAGARAPLPGSRKRWQSASFRPPVRQVHQPAPSPPHSFAIELPSSGTRGSRQPRLSQLHACGREQGARCQNDGTMGCGARG